MIGFAFPYIREAAVHVDITMRVYCISWQVDDRIVTICRRSELQIPQTAGERHIHWHFSATVIIHFFHMSTSSKLN